MPPCPSRGGGRRGGTAFGTSSSSKGDIDLTLRTALISGLKLFGEKYDYELSTKRNKCERLTLRVSNLKGTSFGTSSSSREDYDWFETAVISFFKLFGENYDYELLKKRTSFETSSSSREDYDWFETAVISFFKLFGENYDYELLKKRTSFGTSSSSREDYDWFETAVISFFKLFGENYDYELLKKRKECERLENRSSIGPSTYFWMSCLSRGCLAAAMVGLACCLATVVLLLVVALASLKRYLMTAKKLNTRNKEAPPNKHPQPKETQES
ncbi:hypothetical protein LOK49_LG09G00148 [Camellia lanceoleosa]|uniref:Uncharacterized protein n=1 Tax=Camellia lanceoleosa TaxID=1840588 RepID=A0ACC0GMS8_9ERIC|nr:hypothetical protein LOK49_LG09G00148 [Camellia lanceoleosa]